MKWTLIISNVGIAICLYIFQLEILSNIVFLFLNRALVGIFMSYIQVYIPLWVDYYASQKSKALMIAFVQIAVPVGIVFGYMMTSILINNEITVSLCLKI